MKKNKGYTLVEMIIVIGIMAVLSAVTFVTLYIIKLGKRNAAVHTFENQISNCLVKTKALSDMESTSKGALCMLVQFDTAKNRYVISLANHSGLTYTSIAGTETELPEEVGTIVYVESPANQKATDTTVDNTNMVIQFVKSDGSVKYGGGTYYFYSRGIEPNDTSSSFATITLDAMTGNHLSQ